MTNRASSPRNGPYQVFMLALCIFALAALGFESLSSLDAGTRRILQYADMAVCLAFFVDFLTQFIKAERRWQYFVRWGWIDLLSSIPMVETLRVGRIARLLRILRVLRGVRSTKLLAEFVLGRRRQSAFLAATLVSLLLIVFASIAVLQFENVPNANIITADDALWWSLTTLTTVGYGDRYPITGEGRLVASVLMLGGVGLFGVLSGFIASWFLRPQEEIKEDEIAQLQRDMKDVKRLLEEAIHGAGPPARLHSKDGVLS